MLEKINRMKLIVGNPIKVSTYENEKEDEYIGYFVGIYNRKEGKNITLTSSKLDAYHLSDKFNIYPQDSELIKEKFKGIKLEDIIRIRKVRGKFERISFAEIMSIKK